MTDPRLSSLTAAGVALDDEQIAVIARQTLIYALLWQNQPSERAAELVAHHEEINSAEWQRQVRDVGDCIAALGKCGFGINAP